MGGSISDLFYPGNPDRRRRAAELADALQSLRDQFDVIEVKHNDEINRLSGQMNYVLNAFGVTNSPNWTPRLGRLRVVQCSKIIKRLRPIFASIAHVGETDLTENFIDYGRP